MIHANAPVEQSHVYYFAYGSNMLSKLMKTRMEEGDPQGHYENLGVWELDGYRFVYNLQYPIGGDSEPTYGNIEQAANEKVQGVLYKITAKQVLHLDTDKCEEAPEVYYRAVVKVRSVANPTLFKEAHVYIGQKKYLVNYVLPTPDYLYKVCKGAEEHGIDPNYIKTVLNYQGPLNLQPQSYSWIVPIKEE